MNNLSSVAASRPVPATSDHGHVPVMLPEVMAALAVRPGGRYLDGTFGGGGHARAILAASEPDGLLLALDADAEAISRGRELARESGIGSRLELVQTNFGTLAEAARRAGVVSLDGIVLDLGLSSYQLDQADRGFSFRFDGPLDMRFDRSVGNPAADLVNALPADALADLLARYGEEPRARAIARAIVGARDREPITSTTRLAAIVSDAVGGRRGRDRHPATRTFQALRIVINDELGALTRALEDAVKVLAPGGRLVVIAFHSLEDRTVKRFFQRESASCVCPPRQPICTCDQRPRLRLAERAVRPSPAEIALNPRSRSAIMRVAERLPEPVAHR